MNMEFMHHNISLTRLPISSYEPLCRLVEHLNVPSMIKREYASYINIVFEWEVFFLLLHSHLKRRRKVKCKRTFLSFGFVFSNKEWPMYIVIFEALMNIKKYRGQKTKTRQSLLELLQMGFPL